MSPEEIQELLRKAGVSEDQWKYYTASSEELPGLFGFSGSQGKRFAELFGGLGRFDPTKISEAYGAIDKYGQQQTADIASKLKTGRYDLSQGLMSGTEAIRENVGYKLPGSGAREEEIEEQRAGAYGGAEELERQSEMGLLNLEELLGGRKALVGGKTQSWGQRLMNLVSQVFQMDPGGGGMPGSYGGYVSGGGGMPGRGRNIGGPSGLKPE
tara:strand:- start:3908 stop:4543 length:636 start_codon:yes stop_codon:yes gene_type:complete